MIVWSGKGILSVLVLFVALLLCIEIMPKGQEDYAFVISLFTAAAFSWYFGEKWNNQEPRLVIDAKTGQIINLKSVHALFWIKMEYWGIIFSVLGIIIFAQNSIIGSIISALVVLLIGILIYSNRGSKTQIVEGSNRKTKKEKAQEIIKNIELEKQQVEAEEERLRRRQEKEDPSRFMPQ